MLDRTSSPASLRLALCALILTGGGCSYAFVDGPPKNHAKLPYFECSSSKAWPVVDAVMAATLGIAASAAFVDSGSSTNDTSQGLLAAAEAAAFAISAVSGYQKVDDCREAKELLIASLGSRTGFGAAPAASTFRDPPPDPWVTPPPGLFAPRVTAPPRRPAPEPEEDAIEPDATTTQTPDPAPARPLPSIPAPAVDSETPR